MRQNALKLIHEKAAKLAVSEETILALHRLTKGDIWMPVNTRTKKVAGRIFARKRNPVGQMAS